MDKSWAEDVHRRMLDAGRKASQKSRKFNERADELEKRERQSCVNRHIFDEPTIVLRVSQIQDGDRVLNSYYNNYKFYKGEQERLSNLLQGTVAYHRLLSMFESTDVDDLLG